MTGVIGHGCYNPHRAPRTANPNVKNVNEEKNLNTNREPRAEKRERQGALVPLHRFMPEALAAILRHAPLTPEKVSFAWRAAVGPAVDNATTVQLRDRVLHVRAKAAAWQTEVERSAVVIRARLDAMLGAGAVRYIDVSI